MEQRTEYGTLGIIPTDVLQDKEGNRVGLDDYLDNLVVKSKSASYERVEPYSSPHLGLKQDEVAKFVGGLIRVARTLNEERRGLGWRDDWLMRPPPKQM